MQDPIAPLVAVATNGMFSDPAIDHSDPDGADEGGNPLPSGAERLAKYRETRDVAHLVFRAEVKPTEFVLSPIPANYASVLEQSAPITRNVLAFLASCLEVRLPDGSVLRPRKIVPGAYKTRHAEDDWVETCTAQWGIETVYEMGRVAYERARLPKGSKGPYWYPAG